MNGTENDSKKRCLFCDKLLSGRSDKLFCDDRCRNNYYYKVKNGQKEYIRNINKILLKNHGILKSVNPSGRTSVSRYYLEEQGFDFQCFTGAYTTRKGRIYNLVYDQAYSFDGQDKVTLVVFNRDAQAVVSQHHVRR